MSNKLTQKYDVISTDILSQLGFAGDHNDGYQVTIGDVIYESNGRDRWSIASESDLTPSIAYSAISSYPAASANYGQKLVITGCSFAADVVTVCLECKSDGTATGKIWCAVINSVNSAPSASSFPSDWVVVWNKLS